MPVRARCVWSKSELAWQTCSERLVGAGERQMVHVRQNIVSRVPGLSTWPGPLTAAVACTMQAWFCCMLHCPSVILTYRVDKGNILIWFADIERNATRAAMLLC